MARLGRGRRKQVPTAVQVRTRFGPRTRAEGVLRFSRSVRIEGQYQGRIESTGVLYIEADAEVRAEVRADMVIVAGTVRGDIHADRSVEMLTGGAIYGNVRTGRLRIADGVVFDGKCEMIRSDDPVDIFASGREELKSGLVTY